MKTAIDNNGVEVQVSDDTTVNTINGIHYLLTSAEQIALDAKNAAWAVGVKNRNLLAQIAALEATQTPRRQREALTDSTWMKNLDAQIAALRAQLT